MKFWLPTILALCVALPAAAQVHVRGYTTKNGTYVAPHVRSAPNSTKTDNYGPSSTSNLYTGKGSVTPPATRDADKNGVANLYSRDDDSDTLHDDHDPSQYSPANRSSKGVKNDPWKLYDPKTNY